jgi:hypothetical protein
MPGAAALKAFSTLLESHGKLPSNRPLRAVEEALSL